MMGFLAFVLLTTALLFSDWIQSKVAEVWRQQSSAELSQQFSQNWQSQNTFADQRSTARKNEAP